MLFDFDDGGIAESLQGVTGSWAPTQVVDPADAGLAANLAIAGNPTVGDTCPGSLELTIPLTTLNQAATIGFSFPSPPGVLVTATAMHLSLKLVIADAADAAAAKAELLGNEGVEGFSYLNAFAQWAYPNPVDGGAPDAGYAKNNYGGSPMGYGFGGFPADGGWAEFVLPILASDGGAFTTPTPIYLNQIGLQVGGPPAADAATGPATLPIPLNLQFYVDDIYFQ